MNNDTLCFLSELGLLWKRGQKQRVSSSKLAFEHVSVIMLGELKGGTAVSPLEGKQTDTQSFQGTVSSVLSTRSPLPHSKSGSLCH